MNMPKQALIAISVSLLVINFMAVGMDNPKFNELILRDFKHEKIKPIIRLINNSKKIGYGDQNCISNLNEAGFKAEKNSPLIPFIVTVDPRVRQTAMQQIKDEKEEISTILREEAINKQHLPELYGNIQRKIYIFNQRAQLITESAQKLEKTPNLPWPTVMPVGHLNDSNIQLNLYNTVPAIDLQFNECQTVETLKKTFAEKPTTIFFTLKKATCDMLNNAANVALTQEERDDITLEIIDEITPQKQYLRSNEVIKRREFQHDDLQVLPNDTLPKSNMIMVDFNYHNHGENGYSEKRTRDEALANLNPNIFGFLNDREIGYKKRKLTL
jgi:hypothetical protein